MIKLRWLSLRSSLRIHSYSYRTIVSTSLISIYHDKVNTGILKADNNQVNVVKYLDRLSRYLENNDTSRLQTPSTLNDLNHSKRIRGIYIYGSVGTGKTMLMDMFYSNCHIEKKQRVHFHQFMLSIHKKIHLFKQSLLNQYGHDVHVNLSSERDAIIQVATILSQEVRLLCLDEFQVTDICDALILLKFFQVLWSNGTILVTTSNRPPNDLYQDGLNRHYFLPFIKQIEIECIVKDMNSDHDYRRVMTSRRNVYFVPLNQTTASQLQHEFHQELIQRSVYLSSMSTSPSIQALNCNSLLEYSDIHISVMMGRSFHVKQGCLLRKMCWLEFDELCKSHVGAADFQAICRHFDTIYVCNIPRMSVLSHDVARRFITFIDEVYDAKRRICWTAAASPHELFQELIEADDHDSVSSNNNSDSIPSASLASNSSKSFEVITRGDNTATNSVRKVFKLSDQKTSEATIETEDQATSDCETEFLQGELSSIKELGFAFRRAASRMSEMAGEEYYQQWLQLTQYENIT